MRRYRYQLFFLICVSFFPAIHEFISQIISKKKLKSLFVCCSELCQEINANATHVDVDGSDDTTSSRCAYWTFLKPQMCFILDGCSVHDDEKAISGKENCPPGKPDMIH